MDKLIINGLNAPKDCDGFVKYMTEHPDPLILSTQDNNIKNVIIEDVLDYIKSKYNLSSDHEALLLWDNVKHNILK